MKRLFFILATLIVLIIAAVIILPFFIPVSAYKTTLEEQVSERLGRSVTIGDDLDIKIFPRTAFKVSKLQIDNPDGFKTPYLMRVEKAEIGVNLLKLLSKEVEVQRFVLTSPDIHLERKKSGAVNWEFATAEGATSDNSASDGGADLGAQANDIRFGDVQIVDGKTSYQDAQNGQTYALRDIDVDVTLDGLNTPFVVKGSMIFQDTPSKIDIVMGTLGNYLRKENTDLKFSVDLGDTSAGGDLKLKFVDNVINFDGPVNFKAPDLPALATLAGSPLPETPGFDKFSVEGTLSGNPDVLRLAGAKINFDEIDAEGDLRLNLSGRRPKATGTISTQKLDLRPYTPAPAANAPTGFPAWSDAKMDLTSLRNIDADLDISAETILLNALTTGKSELDLKIDNGRMTAVVPKLTMYEGNGSGRLVVNARGATPSFAGNFKMDKLAAQVFCTEVLNISNILGLGGFEYNFTASGASQAKIISTLDGSGGFDVVEGALKNINFAKYARIATSFKQGINLQTATSAVAAARGPDEVTDFSSFLSKFSINNGIMTATDINMTSPVMGMTGGGTVDLPNQTLDLRLNIQASVNADGSGGLGIAVPVTIKGTFSDPKPSPDIAALFRGQVGEKAREFIGDKLPDSIKKSPAGGLINGVLDGVTGGTDQEADSEGGSPEDAIEDAAKGAIGSLFGRKKKKEDKAPDNR